MNPERPLNLLLVEDDEGHALLIEEILKKTLNLQTICRAKDGAEALKLVKNQSPPPDLILLDIKIPKIDGHQVLKSLKEDQRLRSVPVVVISTTTDQKEIHRCYEMGAAGYIKKPVGYEELKEKIRGLGCYLSVVSLP